MIRKLTSAALLAAFVAVFCATGCNTKADMGATQTSNPKSPDRQLASDPPTPPDPGRLLRPDDAKNDTKK